MKNQILRIVLLFSLLIPILVCGQTAKVTIDFFTDADGDGHGVFHSRQTFTSWSGWKVAYNEFEAWLAAKKAMGLKWGAQLKGRKDCAPNDDAKWTTACFIRRNGGKWETQNFCYGKTFPPGGWAYCNTVKGSSIENLPLEYSVYPNPVSDRLNITPTENWNERVEIKLVDQYARVVKAMQAPNAVKGQTFTLNTSDLKPGIYQLTIQRGDLIESKTIAVKL